MFEKIKKLFSMSLLHLLIASFLRASTVNAANAKSGISTEPYLPYFSVTEAKVGVEIALINALHSSALKVIDEEDAQLSLAASSSGKVAMLLVGGG